MDTLVGSTLPAKFLEVDEVKERLVFSNKMAAGFSGMDSNFKVLQPWGSYISRPDLDTWIDFSMPRGTLCRIDGSPDGRIDAKLHL